MKPDSSSQTSKQASVTVLDVDNSEHLLVFFHNAEAKPTARPSSWAFVQSDKGSIRAAVSVKEQKQQKELIKI